MLKKQKFYEQHFVPKVLGRRKTNELIAKHVHTTGFVLISTCIM